MLTFSVATSQQMSDALLTLKLSGVSARFGAPRDGVLIIHIASADLNESTLFELIHGVAPSVRREP